MQPPNITPPGHSAWAQAPVGGCCSRRRVSMAEPPPWLRPAPVPTDSAVVPPCRTAGRAHSSPHPNASCGEGAGGTGTFLGRLEG